MTKIASQEKFPGPKKKKKKKKSNCQICQNYLFHLLHFFFPFPGPQCFIHKFQNPKFINSRFTTFSENGQISKHRPPPFLDPKLIDLPTPKNRNFLQICHSMLPFEKFCFVRHPKYHSRKKYLRPLIPSQIHVLSKVFTNKHSTYLNGKEQQGFHLRQFIIGENK